FTGTGAEAGALVTIYANGTSVGHATADASGNYTIQSNAPGSTGTATASTTGALACGARNSAQPDSASVARTTGAAAATGRGRRKAERGNPPLIKQYSMDGGEPGGRAAGDDG
ncbi:hypothetical protein, partial [Burkholderia pseudomallei]|uniref:hypothetical protein n=1 Tax=Burkholderia pseudomallei TaxID=28450 RepID=UPI002870776F